MQSTFDKPQFPLARPTTSMSLTKRKEMTLEDLHTRCIIKSPKNKDDEYNKLGYPLYKEYPSTEMIITIPLISTHTSYRSKMLIKVHRNTTLNEVTPNPRYKQFNTDSDPRLGFIPRNT